jgi:hypothetical protein
MSGVSWGWLSVPLWGRTREALARMSELSRMVHFLLKFGVEMGARGPVQMPLYFAVCWILPLSARTDSFGPFRSAR